MKSTTGLARPRDGGEVLKEGRIKNPHVLFDGESEEETPPLTLFWQHPDKEGKGSLYSFLDGRDWGVERIKPLIPGNYHMVR